MLIGRGRGTAPLLPEGTTTTEAPWTVVVGVCSDVETEEEEGEGEKEEDEGEGVCDVRSLVCPVTLPPAAKG